MEIPFSATTRGTALRRQAHTLETLRTQHTTQSIETKTSAKALIAVTKTTSRMAHNIVRRRLRRRTNERDRECEKKRRRQRSRIRFDSRIVYSRRRKPTFCYMFGIWYLYLLSLSIIVQFYALHVLLVFIVRSLAPCSPAPSLRRCASLYILARCFQCGINHKNHYYVYYIPIYIDAMQ